MSSASATKESIDVWIRVALLSLADDCERAAQEHSN
jgi:hypothetical protein